LAVSAGFVTHTEGRDTEASRSQALIETQHAHPSVIVAM
jgi:hypothetical protein